MLSLHPVLNPSTHTCFLCITLQHIPLPCWNNITTIIKAAQPTTATGQLTNPSSNINLQPQLKVYYTPPSPASPNLAW
jgi:hypothetical protein